MHRIHFLSPELNLLLSLKPIALALNIRAIL